MQTKKIHLGAVIGLLLQILFSGSSFAQESNPLNEVVVTASRSPQKLSDIGKVVRVITADVLAKNQGRTLPEVLNNVAGLIIGGNGNSLGELKRVFLRGASAGSTLILIDGIPVNDASGPTGEYDISAIPIDMIERVEIVKGGNSTLYGSDAVAGVINIITQKGAHLMPNARVLTTAGSYSTFKQAVALSGQIKKTALALNASNLTAEGFSSAVPRNGEINFDNDGFKQRALGLNLGRQISNRLALRGSFLLNRNQADFDADAYQDAAGYTLSKTAYVGGLGVCLDIRKGGLNINLNQNNVTNSWDYNGAVINNKSQISNLDAVFNYGLASFVNLTSGLSYKYSATKQINAYALPLDVNNAITSVFTSFFFKTNGGFRSEIGSRYNTHTQYGSNFTYTINPSYLLANRYKVFVNVSSAYRVPSLYQLFSPQYGNPTLKPEMSTTLETGFDLAIFPEKVNLNFSYFNRQINDVIGTTVNYQYVNLGKQKDQGFELEFGVKPHQAIRVNAFYAYVKAKSNPNNTSYRRPKNSFGADFAFAVSKKMDLNLIYKFVGERIDLYYDNKTFKPIELTLDPYHIVDTYIQYKPQPKLTLFADVKNVFNENYVDAIGYTTKGINFNVGVKIELK